MNAATQQFLAHAARLNITVVGIGGTPHPLLGNEKFPWPVAGQIFTPPSERIGGWPAAWKLAEEAGISEPCGNTGQHFADTSGMDLGVYIRLNDGSWGRLA